MTDAAQHLKVIGTVSFETTAIVERLRKATPEAPFVPYTELSALIGKDVQTDGRHNLEAAKNIVLRENGINFGTVWNEGAKLLDDRERVSTGEGIKDRIRRIARKGYRSVTSVQNFDALPMEAKVKHHAYVTIFKITDASTRPKKVLQIEGEVKEVMRALSMKETLKLFEGK
jgi:hypothetical protein